MLTMFMLQLGQCNQSADKAVYGSKSGSAVSVAAIYMHSMT